jgi:hypothetical protein
VAIISERDETISELKMQQAQWNLCKEEWEASRLQYQQYIENISMEKEELVRSHTLETAELRKKNSMLLEQLQRLESAALSTAPSSTGFSAEFGELDNFAGSDGPWDIFSVPNEIQHVEPSVTDTSKAPIRDSDKGNASGLLLMLLLCGAWVASRASSASSSLLPALPEEVRLASKSVLEHIYEDSGIRLAEPTEPSMESSSRPETIIKKEKSLGLSSQESSRTVSFGPSQLYLTTPNSHQMREQAFSLTTSQYNALHEHSSPPGETENAHYNAQSLKESLVALTDQSENSGAEAFPRSLLWNKVPPQVLQDFAQMIATNKAG